jgi:hypothetical protein
MPLRGTNDDEHRQRPVASPLPRAGPWGGGLPRGPMVGWEGPGVGGAPASFSRERSEGSHATLLRCVRSLVARKLASLGMTVR